MPPELVILVPVYRRPHRVEKVLSCIRVSTPDARVLFIPDPDDLDELRAIKAADAEEYPVKGGYATKINQGVRATEEPLLFFGADDLFFHPGWFEHAKELLTNDIGVVGTQDMGNRRVIDGEHATHALVARWYAESPTADGEPGPLHEGYEHNFCDDEFVETAKSRGAWAFCTNAFVEHLHPFWGKGEMDETYEKGLAGFRRDRQIHRSRAHLWGA